MKKFCVVFLSLVFIGSIFANPESWPTYYRDYKVHFFTDPNLSYIPITSDSQYRSTRERFVYFRDNWERVQNYFLETEGWEEVTDFSIRLTVPNVTTSNGAPTYLTIEKLVLQHSNGSYNAPMLAFGSFKNALNNRHLYVLFYSDRELAMQRAFKIRAFWSRPGASFGENDGRISESERITETFVGIRQIP
jgi:hypothetical protein